MSPATLLGVFGLTAFGSLQEAPATVRGRVLSAETRAPIAGAAIRIRHRGALEFAVTDSNGFYRVTGIVPGRIVVVAQALDRAPLETLVQVPAGGNIPLDFSLELRPIIMPLLFAEIQARRLAPPGLTRDGFRQEGETELRALEASPGVAELGLAGSSNPDSGDPGSVLYVRGAAADLKLVLIDGAPVYAPFHLSGLLDAFPDGVLSDATLYIGGTPARFDGGLSYVLDLDIREGDEERIRTAGSIDMLGASARVEGPVGSAGRALLSGRVLHGLGYPLVTGDSDLPYGYGDFLGRLDADVGGGKVSFTGFWNRESVRLDIGKFEEAGAAESAYWGNLAGSVRYRRPLGSGSLNLTASYGRFDTRLPVPRDGPDGGPTSVARALGQTSRTRTEAFYESAEGRVQWQVGGGFDTHETVLDQRTVFGDTTALAIGQANVAAAWGEAVWHVVPQVELRAGMRATHFAPDDIARLSPRATATWHVSESADLRLSAGRFFQLVRGPESILSSDLTGPTLGSRTPVLDTAVPLGELPLLAVAGATHVVVGLENTLDNGVDVGVEGFFKSFDDLPGAEKLFSSGADLWVQAREGPVRGWLGYSLAWVWTNEPSENTRFVGRQLLSGGLATEYRGFDLGLRLSYGSGLPFQSVSKASQVDGGEGEVPGISGAPDNSYVRLDAEISRRWITSVGGSRFEIAPYLRLLNALDRRDALFYQSGTNAPDQPVPLASVPLLAVFGVAWSF